MGEKGKHSSIFKHKYWRPFSAFPFEMRGYWLDRCAALMIPDWICNYSYVCMGRGVYVKHGITYDAAPTESGVKLLKLEESEGHYSVRWRQPREEEESSIIVK